MNLDVLVRVVETHLVDANELAASKIMDHSFTSAYSDMPDRQKRKDVANKRKRSPNQTVRVSVICCIYFQFTLALTRRTEVFKVFLFVDFH